jgi:AcrR family transcriptional regulator
MPHQTETPDRRKNRTVAALRGALIELIIEKHYDAITVQDIIDRANVGRSTFYSHFRDKEDILITDWKRFLGLIATHIDLEAAPNGRKAPIEGLMMHLKDYYAFYRALVRSGKTERLFNLGTEFLAELIEEKIVASGRSAENLWVPPSVCGHYIALQIFGFLKWWLDRGMPYTPAEMGKMFQQLVAPGIANVMRGGGRAGEDMGPGVDNYKSATILKKATDL